MSSFEMLSWNESVILPKVGTLVCVKHKQTYPVPVQVQRLLLLGNSCVLICAHACADLEQQASLLTLGKYEPNYTSYISAPLMLVVSASEEQLIRRWRLSRLAGWDYNQCEHENGDWDIQFIQDYPLLIQQFQQKLLPLKESCCP